MTRMSTFKLCVPDREFLRAAWKRLCCRSSFSFVLFFFFFYVYVSVHIRQYENTHIYSSTPFSTKQTVIWWQLLNTIEPSTLMIRKKKNIISKIIYVSPICVQLSLKREGGLQHLAILPTMMQIFYFLRKLDTHSRFKDSTTRPRPYPPYSPLVALNWWSLSDKKCTVFKKLQPH